MTWLILFSVAGGIALASQRWLPDIYLNSLDTCTTAALCLLLFGVGIDLGVNKHVWRNLRHVGYRVLYIPTGIAVGSIAGALLSGVILRMPLNEAGAIGAGFGWYSLSGVLLTKIHSAEIGALAFLTNLIREMLAFIFIPLIARRISKLCTLAPGGATAMDTTLPVIDRVAGSEIALLAFISGMVLSGLVPLLVPLIVRL